ncbi:MAG: hypothetical protein KAT70_07630 [Thermoplasmata archaeon]|nr:hypothetical protein [Thermoplasmata archaeon]
MVVKDKVGRKRYVAFTVDGGCHLRRGEMIHAINVSLPRNLPRSNVNLTVFNGEAGIVLCPHTAKDEMIRSLVSIRSVGGRGVKVRTVATSGTIKKARTRLEKVVKTSL